MAGDDRRPSAVDMATQQAGEQVQSLDIEAGQRVSFEVHVLGVL